MSDLFTSAGLDKEAPRPLADRMRPTSLSEVVGPSTVRHPADETTTAALRPRRSMGVSKKKHPISTSGATSSP